MKSKIKTNIEQRRKAIFILRNTPDLREQMTRLLAEGVSKKDLLKSFLDFLVELKTDDSAA